MLFLTGDIVTLGRLYDKHYKVKIREWTATNITIEILYSSTTGDFKQTEYLSMPNIYGNTPSIITILDTQFEIINMYKSGGPTINFVEEVSTYATPATYFTARVFPKYSLTHPIFFLPLKYLDICA